MQPIELSLLPRRRPEGGGHPPILDTAKRREMRLLSFARRSIWFVRVQEAGPLLVRTVQLLWTAMLEPAAENRAPPGNVLESGSGTWSSA